MSKTVTMPQFMDPNTQDLICQLNNYGIICVSGMDAKAFLQGQLTCHMDEVTTTQAQLACYCNHKGRILTTFYIWQHHASYYLCLARDSIATTLQILKKYAVFSQVALNDQSNLWQLDGIMGPMITTQLNNHLENLNPNSYGVSQQQNTTFIYLNNYEKCQRYLCISQNPILINSLNIAATPNHCEAWIYLDIQQHIYMSQASSSTLFTPAATNFMHHGGVSLDKGCYVGQEIIARMHHLGQCKQALYALLYSGTIRPEVGSHIKNHQGKIVGTVTQATIDATQHYLIQAVITKTAIQEPLYYQQQLISLAKG